MRMPLGYVILSGAKDEHIREGVFADKNDEE
jgi:hypothetical protein